MAKSILKGNTRTVKVPIEEDTKRNNWFNPALIPHDLFKKKILIGQVGYHRKNSKEKDPKFGTGKPRVWIRPWCEIPGIPLKYAIQASAAYGEEDIFHFIDNEQADEMWLVDLRKTKNNVIGRFTNESIPFDRRYAKEKLENRIRPFKPENVETRPVMKMNLNLTEILHTKRPVLDLNVENGQVKETETTLWEAAKTVAVSERAWACFVDAKYTTLGSKGVVPVAIDPQNDWGIYLGKRYASPRRKEAIEFLTEAKNSNQTSIFRKEFKNENLLSNWGKQD